jgi:chaperonin GroEL
MEDALNATRAAVSEGIIAGGGSAYVHAQKSVEKLVDTLEGDEKTGAMIVAKALESPLRIIAENAGLEGAVVVNKVKEQDDAIGFDAVHETYVNMMDEGIIDPVKVTKNALTNAVSISATMLTTEAAVADIKEEKAEVAANNADMGY